MPEVTGIRQLQDETSTPTPTVKVDKIAALKKALPDLDECLLEAFSHEERVGLLKILKQLSLTGNFQALKLSLAYLFGTPVDRVEHSGPEGAAIPIEISSKIAQAYGSNSQKTREAKGREFSGD